jgi:hypothetical protein
MKHQHAAVEAEARTPAAIEWYQQEAERVRHQR